MRNVCNLQQKKNEYMPAGSSCESAKGDGGEMSGTGDVENDGIWKVMGVMEMMTCRWRRQRKFPK